MGNLAGFDPTFTGKESINEAHDGVECLLHPFHSIMFHDAFHHALELMAPVSVPHKGIVLEQNLPQLSETAVFS